MSDEQRKNLGMANRLDDAVQADLTGQPMPDPERDKWPEWKLEREKRAEQKTNNIVRLTRLINETVP